MTRRITTPDGSEPFDVPDLVTEAALDIGDRDIRDLSIPELQALGIYLYCPDCGEWLWDGSEWRESCECGWPAPDAITGPADDWPPPEFGGES